MSALTGLLGHLEQRDPGGVIGLYIYGSSATGSLQVGSDIDLLLLTRKSLTSAERQSLVSLLLRTSGWSGHAAQFPEAAGRRPVDLTVLAIGEERPWRPRPQRDFQYGEWLRHDLISGHLPQPAIDPDVVIMLASALASHEVLRGPALETVVGTVPPELLRQAARAVIPGLLEGLVGDERNVLLTLARILITLETGAIVAKDQAANQVAPRLSESEQQLIYRARDGYLGLVADGWSDVLPATMMLAQKLASQANEHGLSSSFV